MEGKDGARQETGLDWTANPGHKLDSIYFPNMAFHLAFAQFGHTIFFECFPPPFSSQFQPKMSAYALGKSTSSTTIRVQPVQLRPRTLTDLSASFCVGQTSFVPNSSATYRMRSFPYRTFRHSHLEDNYYTDEYFRFSSQYRQVPRIERYDRRDHKSVPYTYWTGGEVDCLYRSDQPDNYRRTYEPYRDDYSYAVWSAPRRKLLQGLI